LESGGSKPIAEQLQSIRGCFAVVIANSPRDIISDVNLDVRIAIDSGAKAGLRSAVNLGEHDGTCASSAGDLKVRQQALAVTAPWGIVQNNERLGQTGQERIPSGGG
jgi:hypothetical protein